MATILIVDDVPAHRIFLIRLLGPLGHRLLEAANGRDALTAAQADPPDLIITDVLMPVMDGYELVRQLQLDPGTTGIPVLFYTAPYGEREARARARFGGIPFILKKPAKPDEVLQIVSRVLARELDISPTAPAASPFDNGDREYLPLVSDPPSDVAEDLRVANARLRALINIGLDLSARQDTEQLLESVCAAAHDLFGACYATLGIVDLAGPTVARFVACGTDATDCIKAGDALLGILRTVVTSGRPVRGENPGGDPAALQLPPSHPLIGNYLVVPIMSPTHVHGWICLASTNRRAFTGEDEQLLMALAGQVGRIYEIDAEIADHRATTSALRRERDRSQRYLDTAQVILLALDPDGRIQLVNRYACAVLGWTANELLGQKWIDMCTPASGRAALWSRFHEVVDGDLRVVEAPIVSRSGEERMFEWRNTVLYDEDNVIVGTFSSGADITEQTRTAAAFRVAEERLRFVLDAAGVGIWDMDFTTGVLRWSNIMEAQYGLVAGSFGGTFQAFAERIHPDDRTATLETIAAANRSGADFTVIHRTLWHDGTIRWLSGAGRIQLGSDGEPARGVGISLDITERRQLEEQYYQAQKMEAIGRLAGGVAHDFNNLLTVILGYCELLLGDVSLDDVRLADIVEIQKAGVTATALTRQLLAFSRKQIIAPAQLDLNVIVREMQGMLARLIREDIEVVLRLPAGLAPIKADRSQIEQLVLNLAVNARDAMPDGGTLTIETANVELDEHYPRTHFNVKPGWYVSLVVSDTGVGMTPEVKARLFEPFFTTKEVGKGTGLGLATVHGIVALSDGHINVYTEPGHGTAFQIYLPRVDDDQAPLEIPVQALSQPTTARTVLVVEDGEGLRELTRRLLQRQGYTVLVAENAGEALEVFAGNPGIDVLLTDVVMPGESGPALAQQLSELNRGLKVIYMSGYTEEAIVHHGVIDPGISFLHKPFSSESLGRIVRHALGDEAPVLGPAVSSPAVAAALPHG